MSEQAPEMILAEPYDGNSNAGRWTATPRYPELPTQYRRADIPWLQGELVKRIKCAHDAINDAHPSDRADLHLVEGSIEIFSDILSALGRKG